MLDLSRLLPGPFLTQLLADLGADVVKVEEPEVGDPARFIPPDVEGAGFAFSAFNKGKRSVALDLKAAGARDIILRLAARSDIFVESFRPGVLDRLGLGDAALAAANPRLVRVSLVGYPEGPLRDAPGHDINYQAVAGILHAQGPPERPMVGVVTLADLGGALYGASGVLAALYERERTGRGRRVEVALADAAVALNAANLQRARAGDELPARGAHELAGGLPGYGVYACADGGFVALGALEGKFWARFCALVGRADLVERHLDPTAIVEVEAIFRAGGARDDWCARLVAAGVPATPAVDLREAAARHAGRIGAGAPLTGRASAGRVPTLGEHDDEVLREAGTQTF